MSKMKLRELEYKVAWKQAVGGRRKWNSVAFYSFFKAKNGLHFWTRQICSCISSSAFLILSPISAPLALLWKESSDKERRNGEDNSGFFLLKTSTVSERAINLENRKILSETPRGRLGLHFSFWVHRASPNPKGIQVLTYWCRATEVSRLWPLGWIKIPWREWFYFGHSKMELSSSIVSWVWLCWWVFGVVVSLVSLEASLGHWPPELRYWISWKKKKKRNVLSIRSSVELKWNHSVKRILMLKGLSMSVKLFI